MGNQCSTCTNVEQKTQKFIDYNIKQQDVFGRASLNSNFNQNSQFTEPSRSQHFIPSASTQSPYQYDHNSHQNSPNSQLKRVKKPKVQFPYNATYQGEWVGDQRDGYGKQIWADGTTYQGEWRKDRAHGNGTFVYSNGDIYKGEWDKDQICGYGQFTSQDGGTYEGFWQDDAHDGMGKQLWANGEQYQGSYSQGSQWGNGIYLWPNGDIFQGSWVDNVIEGDGIFTYSDGKEYVGQWKNNKFHGFGKYSWPDGRLYEGYFRNGEKQGIGQYRSSNGKVYEGFWKGGQQSGQGSTTFQGETTFGEYVDGKKIQDISEQEFRQEFSKFNNIQEPQANHGQYQKSIFHDIEIEPVPNNFNSEEYILSQFSHRDKQIDPNQSQSKINQIGNSSTSVRDNKSNNNDFHITPITTNQMQNGHSQNTKTLFLKLDDSDDKLISKDSRGFQ